MTGTHVQRSTHALPAPPPGAPRPDRHADRASDAWGADTGTDGTHAGRLAENVMHFGRVLRASGLRVGSDRIALSLQALELDGLASRDDLHAVLAACLLERIEDRPLFDQAFALFWRDPDLMGRILSMLLPQVEGPERGTPPPENRRLADALFGHRAQQRPPEPEQRIEIDASLTWSASEVLRKADFDTMTAQEWLQARRVIEHWRARLPMQISRRTEPAAHGRRLDWRRVAATSARQGGELARLAWRRPRLRPAPLVALIDISGSMSNYSRMFLHFLHALIGSDRRNHSFLFGTRLTNVTRMMRNRDPDHAVAACVRAVDDWSGGTRLAGCLHDFNRQWSRRVLGQNATVLLVSDGLERGDVGELAFEAERLSKSCRRMIWLNPLLRYEAFQPKAAGIRTLLPLVDAHLPVHNLDSLAALSQVLAAMPVRTGGRSRAVTQSRSFLELPTCN